MVDDASSLAPIERLWTPWRMRYVGGGAAETGCVFCNRLAGEDDVASLILYRGPRCFVIMNLFPYNTAHLMIVPNAHVDTPERMDPADLIEMSSLLGPLLSALRRAFNPAGFNIGMNVGAVAGAGVADHLHQHVVPRWQGDANFMPIIASTMVLPELIPVSYAKVRAELNREALFDEARQSEPLVTRFVAVTSDRGRVALVRDDGGWMIPAVAVAPDRAVWSSVASELAVRGMRGSLAGWAGPARADDRSATAVTVVIDEPADGQSIKLFTVADAVALLDGAIGGDVLRRALDNLEPAV